jgi:hypothetical protein
MMLARGASVADMLAYGPRFLGRFAASIMCATSSMLISLSQMPAASVGGARSVIAAAFAPHTMYQNFAKQRGAHRISPAMAAGVDKRFCEVSDIVQVVENWEAADA